MLHQSLHGYPQTGGNVGRVFRLVLDYIQANPLLADWYENIPSYCQRTRQSAQLAALDPLIADGVSHVALHHGLPNWKAFAAAFAIVAPAYQDDHMTLLRIRKICAMRAPGAISRDDPYSLQRDFLLDAPLQPQSESLLSLHASQSLDEHELPLLSRLGPGWKSLNHVWGSAGGDIRVQSSDARVTDLASFAARNDGVWLLHDPRAAELEDIPALPRRHPGALSRLPARSSTKRRSRLIIMLRRDFPCELVDSSPRVEARYDNGIHLRNALHAVDDDELMIFLRWSDVGSGLAYSIQLFDEHGDKVGQIERDAFLRREPLAASSDRHIDVAGRRLSRAADPLRCRYGRESWRGLAPGR